MVVACLVGSRMMLNIIKDLGRLCEQMLLGFRGLDNISEGRILTNDNR